MDGRNDQVQLCELLRGIGCVYAIVPRNGGVGMCVCVSDAEFLFDPGGQFVGSRPHDGTSELQLAIERERRPDVRDEIALRAIRSLEKARTLANGLLGTLRLRSLEPGLQVAITKRVEEVLAEIERGLLEPKIDPPPSLAEHYERLMRQIEAQLSTTLDPSGEIELVVDVIRKELGMPPPHV